MTDHATLAATAQATFPNSTITAEHDYESFRTYLYQLVQQLPDDKQDRLNCLYRIGCRVAATWREPFAGWGVRLVEVELPQVEAAMRARGVLR